MSSFLLFSESLCHEMSEAVRKLSNNGWGDLDIQHAYSEHTNDGLSLPIHPVPRPLVNILTFLTGMYPSSVSCPQINITIYNQFKKQL